MTNTKNNKKQIEKEGKIGNVLATVFILAGTICFLGTICRMCPEPSNYASLRGTVIRLFEKEEPRQK
jgi:hypothetical protein